MGLTTDLDKSALEQFSSFVEDDFKLKKSDELVVYGSSPDFDEVYSDPNGLIRRFFTPYFDVIAVGGKTGKWELTA
jgi:hypothetical protein